MYSQSDSSVNIASDKRERRRSPRFSVTLGAHIRDATGAKALSVTSACTLDVNTSGVQLEWPVCEHCHVTGAAAGDSDSAEAIPPGCCLKPFDRRKCRSRELSFCFELPGNHMVRARGKVAYVHHTPGELFDKVGVEFTSVEGDGLQIIEAVLKSTRNVLVIDNSSDLAEELAVRITQIGQETVSATNCEEAVEILENDNIDLIVSGVAMPAMEGPYIIGTLKDAAPLVPIIVVTPPGVECDPDTIEALGCFAVLPQPCNTAALEMLIDQALGLDNDDDSGDLVKL